LLNLLTTLSLPVCVAVVWVRSYRLSDTMTLSNRSGAWSISSFNGGVLCVSWGTGSRTEPFKVSLNPTDWHTFDAWDNLWLGSRNRRSFLGFYGGSVGSGGEAWRFAVLPFWVLEAVSAALPARAFWRATRARRRSRRGLCPSCGYDVRATPGRCPECGAESPAPISN
jgi:hypothetical protein